METNGLSPSSVSLGPKLHPVGGLQIHHIIYRGFQGFFLLGLLTGFSLLTSAAIFHRGHGNHMLIMVYTGAILSLVSCVLLVVFCVARKKSFRKIEERYMKELEEQERFISIYHSKLMESPFVVSKYPVKSIEDTKGSDKYSWDDPFYDDKQYKSKAILQSTSADCLKQKSSIEFQKKNPCLHDEYNYIRSSCVQYNQYSIRPEGNCPACNHMAAKKRSKQTVKGGSRRHRRTYSDVNSMPSYSHKTSPVNFPIKEHQPSFSPPRKNLLSPIHLPLSRSDSAPQSYDPCENRLTNSPWDQSASQSYNPFENRLTNSPWDHHQRYLPSDESLSLKFSSPDNSTCQNYDRGSPPLLLQVPLGFHSTCNSTQSDMLRYSPQNEKPHPRRYHIQDMVKGSINIRSVDNSLLDPSYLDTDRHRIGERKQDIIETTRQIMNNTDNLKSECQLFYQTQAFDRGSKPVRKYSKKRSKRNVSDRRPILRHQLSLPHEQIYVNTLPHGIDVRLNRKNSSKR